MRNMISKLSLVVAGVLLSLGWAILTPTAVKEPESPLSSFSLATSNCPNDGVNKISRGLQSRMQKLVAEMSQSLSVLDCIAPYDKLEEWARVIFESMTAESRTFHSIEHAFDMSDNAVDEVQKLSAFYHDIIYYSVDGGLSTDQEAIVGDVIDENVDGAIYLTDSNSDLGEGDYSRMVVDIFGFEGGQQLKPFGGLNEFLSATLAVRSLSQYLRPQYLAEIAACIEATIPFRSGEPMEDLYDRLKKLFSYQILGIYFLNQTLP